MEAPSTATLRSLSDTDLTVSTSAEDIRGRAVKDKDGKEIGRVDDLLIDDSDDTIRFMRVESGGFLGIGETKVLIPIEAIAQITDVEVRINQSHDHVARAPRYDPVLVADRSCQDELYRSCDLSSF